MIHKDSRSNLNAVLQGDDNLDPDFNSENEELDVNKICQEDDEDRSQIYN